MAEFFNDASLEIERVFLWQTLQNVFEKNFDTWGVQMFCDSLSDVDDEPTRLVLADIPSEGEDSLQIWGELSKVQFLGKVTILFHDAFGREIFNYEITADSMTQCSPEPSPMDREDLILLSKDVENTVWSEEQSRKCAERLLFFS